jgi:hypothetical protein
MGNRLEAQIELSLPPNHEGPRGNHVVLPAGNRQHSVVGSSREVVAGLGSKSNEMPHVNVYPCPEIERPASKLPGGAGFGHPST